MALHEKLIAIQAKCQDIIDRSNDPTSQPDAIAALAQVNSIVQNQQMVQLLTAVVTELQSAQSVVTEWIDAKGNYYMCAIDGTTVKTYTPSGEDFIPTEPCRPANLSSHSATLSSIKKPRSIPAYHRVRGQEQVTIKADKTFVEIKVRSGEVSSSIGDGVLKAGDCVAWSDFEGIGEIILNGHDEDTEYLIVTREPEAMAIFMPVPTEAETTEADPEYLLTGDLLPIPVETIAAA